jgi:homocysteine S-methyltransferase
MPPKTPIHLLDGGLGTILADRYDTVFDGSTPLWSSHLLLLESGQKTLLDAQSAFADSGADIILSGTYQASYTGFESSGIKDREEAEKFMRGGVQIAKKASQGRENGKVALSMGAYGATMIPGAEYSGDYDAAHSSVAQLADWHHERLSAFYGSSPEKSVCWDDVEYVAFETLPRIEEVKAVRQVMESIPEKEMKGYWISCVFPGEGNKLPDGSTIPTVVDAMLGGEERKPMGIGLNCTRVGKVEGLVLEFEDAVEALGFAGKVALVFYPDGTQGEVYNTSTKEWEKVGGMQESKIPWDEMMFGIIERAQARGVWRKIFVGGCCKTTPEHIAKLRKLIDKL